MTKILIIEDEALIAEDLADTCRDLGYEVIEPAFTAGEGLQKLESGKPDLVLLDINLEDDIDGIEIALFINEKYRIPFIYLTSHSDATTIHKAKQTTPAAYLVKPFREKDLYSAIEIALYKNQKEKDISIELISKSLIQPLTPREYDILLLIYQGKSNKEICSILFLSLNTVKFHTKNIFTKMNINSRQQAIVMIRNMI